MGKLLFSYSLSASLSPPLSLSLSPSLPHYFLKCQIFCRWVARKNPFFSPGAVGLSMMAQGLSIHGIYYEM